MNQPDASRAWRAHFSAPAADLLQIAVTFAGFDLQAALLRCFKKSKAGRISEPTVEAVLQEMSDEAEGPAEASARRAAAAAAFLAGRVALQPEGC